MQELLNALRAKGYNFTPSIFNGAVERFDRNKPGTGWCSTKRTQVGDKIFFSAVFGDFTEGEIMHRHKDSGAADLTPEEQQELQAKLDQEAKAFQENKLKKQAEAAVRAASIYDSCQTPGPNFRSQYEINKKLLARAPGVKISEKTLVLPISNNGQIASLQFIEPDGTKKFLSGGKLKGSYFLIPGSNPDIKKVYLAEGYATGMSVHMATGASVLVCFNANNLEQMARGLATDSKTWPGNIPEVIIAADNDINTPGNPGLTHAKNAAAILHGSGIKASVVYPEFTKEEADAKATDFNDAHAIYGLERIKNLLNTIPSPEPVPPSGSTCLPGVQGPDTINTGSGAGVHKLPGIEEFKKLPVVFSKTGTPMKPPQNLVVTALDQGFGDILMRDKRSVFLWLGTHWEEQDPDNFRFHVKAMAQYVRSGFASNGELEDIAQLYLEQIPSVRGKSTFFQQVPNFANFQDGTLEITREKSTAKFTLVFREHRKEDLLTWVLPYEYKAPRAENKKFSEWLDRCFAGDLDKEGKLRALRQVGGGTMLSLFPRVSFLHGPAGTGKSTFAKLCMRFLGQGVYSSVDLGQQKEFLLQTMVNKQANIVTDISTRVFDPSQLKRYEDRIPELVNRKNKDAVLAYLPAAHIYCGNKLPKGIDGASNAFDRRLTLVEFKNVLAGPDGDYTRDFEQVILDHGPGAVLEFFEQGLKDLCTTGGIYFNPESGRKILHNWKVSNSTVSQFLEAVEHGEISVDGKAKLLLEPGSLLPRSVVSECYRQWYDSKLQPSDINALYQELEGRGFVTKRKPDTRYITGFRVEGREMSGGVSGAVGSGF